MMGCRACVKKGVNVKKGREQKRRRTKPLPGRGGLGGVRVWAAGRGDERESMAPGKRAKALRRSLLPGALLFLALGALVSSAFYVRRPRGAISLAGPGMAMPGGGPEHVSYLPAAPCGNLRELWSTRLEAEIPGPCAVAADRVFAACRNGFLYCLDLDGGRPLWLFDVKGEITSMPAVFEGGVLVSTLDGRVVCVDGKGGLLWEVEVGGSVLSSPVPSGKRVYFTSLDGFLYCVDAARGSEKWRFQADAPLEVSPCIYEGQVLCASYEGTLFALDAGSGRLLWSTHLQGLPVCFPVADEGRVFQVTDAELRCADSQSGKTLWSLALGGKVLSNPAVRGNQLVILMGGPGEGSFLLSLDARTGDRLWQVALGMETGKANILATNNDVYLATSDRVLALEWETGAPTLGYDAEGALPSTLTVTQDRLLVGTERRKVFCLGE